MSLSFGSSSGVLFVVAAASGTGKTSLVKALLAQVDNLYVSVSHTTRAPRVGEIDGINYHFVDKDTFIAKIGRGEFIESAEVFGNLYGTSQDSVSTELALGKNVLLEIDWQGALQVQTLFPDAQLIFIVPPSREALRERLSNRGQDSEAIIAERLAGAVLEMQQHVLFDYLIVNDVFDVALEELKAIIMTSQLTTLQQTQKHAQLLEKLLS